MADGKDKKKPSSGTPGSSGARGPSSSRSGAGRRPARSSTPKPPPEETPLVEQDQGVEAEHGEAREAAPAGVSTATAAAVKATDAPAVSERRRRLYRVPVLGAIVYLIAPPRTRAPSKLRRGVSGLSGVVAVIGIAMLVYPWVGHMYPAPLRWPVEKGIEWSNVFSDLESNRIQDRLDDQFADEQLAAKFTSRQLADGDPLTRIVIPKLGVDTMVVEGTSTSALKAGAGHYPQTPLPGNKGNVAIAGHRTTYGRPFNRVDALRPGDEIALHTPVGVFVYQVTQDPWVTNPNDWSVIQPSDEALLTLTSCHPKGSDRQRIIVRAKLVRSEPVQAKPAAA